MKRPKSHTACIWSFHWVSHSSLRLCGNDPGLREALSAERGTPDDSWSHSIDDRPLVCWTFIWLFIQLTHLWTIYGLNFCLFGFMTVLWTYYCIFVIQWSFDFIGIEDDIGLFTFLVCLCKLWGRLRLRVCCLKAFVPCYILAEDTVLEFLKCQSGKGHWSAREVRQTWSSWILDNASCKTRWNRCQNWWWEK